MKKVKRNVLLNPGPATTTNSVKNSLVVPDICPREKEFGNLLESLISDLTRLVHGNEDYTCVLFSGSGTAGVEAAINSVIPDGKKLLVVDNGAYGKRMVHLANTYNIPVVHYKINYGDYPNLNDLETLIINNSGISHIAVVHHETTTGMLNPIGEISKLSHRHGIEIIVDAMSSYAGVPINIRALNIEYLISSSNKCIQGMPGLTFVICKKKCLSNLGNLKRSYYLDLKSQYEYLKKYRQMQFTPPVQICYALRKALDEYFKETQKGRSSRYTKNWETLYFGLKKLGFRFLLTPQQESKILVAVCEPKDKKYDFNHMHDWLYEHGFTIYPGKGAKEKTFRLAIIGDLKQNDIKAFLRSLKNYIKENNIDI